MFDLREWIPIEALLPFIGGLLLWFGLNYVVLAPEVIGPRLAERYYLPACMANVMAARDGFAADTAARVASFEQQLQDRAAAARTTIEDQVGGLFGNDEYGQALESLIMDFGQGTAQIEMGIAVSLGEQRTQFQSDMASSIEGRRAAQRFETPDAFCTCNVITAYAERTELAAHVASFRLYRPAMIGQLEVGTFFEACGSAPVVMP